MRKFIKISTSVIAIFTATVFIAVCFYSRTLPDKFYLSDNENFELSTFLKVNSTSSPKISKEVSSTNSRKLTTTLKLFNIVPIKEVNIQKTNDVYLVPSGNVFGVKMFTKGVVVVGLNDIQSDIGVFNPAKSAGIKVGDIITQINGVKMSTNEDVSDILKSSNGKSLTINVKRKGEDLCFEVTPVKNKLDGQYKAGIWVRDSSAGLGTITYYNPKSKSFGGLGHSICDVDTGEILPLLSGEVVDVSINGVTKGQAGQAGELQGVFTSNTPMGTIDFNNSAGVFGKLKTIEVQREAIPMCLKQNIKTGKAKILATTDGTQPKEYDILIEKISMTQNKQTKNLVIKITDNALLAKTGGIVQGMSGSPILQNGKLVGAVTHVFVNDPTKGYGIFVENMYNFSKEIDNEVQKKSS
jgi:stage IV sporulation protein B